MSDNLRHLTPGDHPDAWLVNRAKAKPVSLAVVVPPAMTIEPSCAMARL